MKNMNIQWFPGHMAKARREIEEKLKLVDLVLELVDARAPLSSQNQMLHQVIKNKPKMVLLMKKEMADQQRTEQWIRYYAEQGRPAIGVDVNNQAYIQQTIQLAKGLGQNNLDKLRSKGVAPRAIRAMIIGIPNVGKSTLINRFANK